MLNRDSASHPLVQFGEILKQVQDDKSRKFQISLVRFWNLEITIEPLPPGTLESYLEKQRLRQWC